MKGDTNCMFLSCAAPVPLLCLSVCVCVTIGQRAEGLSVRVGADHFLVSHHPGGGVIHLRTEEQTVKTQTQQRSVRLKCGTQGQG